MDFFILFALLGLVALARIVVGLGGMPKADLAFDWAAVRAQILVSLGAEATAYRAQREETTQRRAAKRQRRWVRRATTAEVRAQALAAAKAARQASRVAAKATAREKSAAVALRHGHGLLRAQAAVRAARKAALSGAVPCEGYGIAAVKAAKLARRAEQYTVAKARRAEAAAAKAQAKASARAAGKAAADAAFAAQQAVKVANAAAATRVAVAAARKAAHQQRLLSLLADKTAVRLAHAVVRAGAKAEAKAEFVQWLDENGHTVRGEAFVAANEAAWVSAKAEEGYQAHFGFTAEAVAAADKAAYERRATVRAIRAARQGKAVVA